MCSREIETRISDLHKAMSNTVVFLGMKEIFCYINSAFSNSSFLIVVLLYSYIEGQVTIILDVLVVVIYENISQDDKYSLSFIDSRVEIRIN